MYTRHRDPKQVKRDQDLRQIAGKTPSLNLKWLQGWLRLKVGFSLRINCHICDKSWTKLNRLASQMIRHNTNLQRPNKIVLNLIWCVQLKAPSAEFHDKTNSLKLILARRLNCLCHLIQSKMINNIWGKTVRRKWSLWECAWTTDYSISRKVSTSTTSKDSRRIIV